MGRDELKLCNSFFKASHGFCRPFYRHIPPSSHQFPVYNGKAGVGEQVSCDSHAENRQQNPSSEQSSTTVLSNPSNVNLYFECVQKGLYQWRNIKHLAAIGVMEMLGMTSQCLADWRKWFPGGTIGGNRPENGWFNFLPIINGVKPKYIMDSICFTHPCLTLQQGI